MNDKCVSDWYPHQKTQPSLSLTIQPDISLNYTERGLLWGTVSLAVQAFYDPTCQYSEHSIVAYAAQARNAKSANRCHVI